MNKTKEQTTKPFFTDEEVDFLNSLALGKKRKNRKKN